MKTIKIFFVVVFALIANQQLNAQSDKLQRTIGIKTEKIKVSGICTMDKHHIEKAAYLVDGVKSAVYDEFAQVLTLKYSVFAKAVTDNVQKKIASTGYDTEKYKASDAAYQKQNTCCCCGRMQTNRNR